MPYVIGLVLVVVVVAYVLVQRARESRHLEQIVRGFPAIQRAAFDHSGAGLDIEALKAVAARQSFTTVKGFRLVYTCDPGEQGGMVHHLSGQMVRPNRDLLIRCMLLILAILHKELEEARVDPLPQFDVHESEYGTQHLEFSLSDESHAALRRILFMRVDGSMMSAEG